MKTNNSGNTMNGFVRPKSPYRKVCSDDIDFSVATIVEDSWGMVKSKPNWKEETGTIFLRRLFEVSPRLQRLWGFGNIRPNDLKGKEFASRGATLLKMVDSAMDMLGPDLAPLEKFLFTLGRQHIHMGAEPEFWPLVGDALMYTLKTSLGEMFSDLEDNAWTVIYDFMAYWMIEGLIAEKEDVWNSTQKVKETIHKATSKGDKPPGVVAIPRISVSSASSNASSSDEEEEEVEGNVYDRMECEDIEFRTVELVLDSWNKFINIPNWKQESSNYILKRLFEMAPEVKTAWGFAPDFDPDNLSDPNQNKFMQKGLGFITGVDRTIVFIGPDLEPLTIELQQLGRIHYRFMAAKPKYWPFVGAALMDTLEKLLGPKIWNKETKEAWESMYHFMSYWMIEGLLAEQRGY